MVLVELKKALLMANGKKVFGENVQRLRFKRKLTQDQLAQNCGLTLRYIQMIEAGAKFPRLHTLRALSHSLNCTWNDLFAKL
ncbi:MAG: helix-turn-helix domain-containing protein [Verrucomicrobiales bacterium]|jgi:transcriptional regulator with XRE-family HTH domain|nr:helix-turn-helix domain-containing protein [Verrucomicrobiales bacterium]